MLTLTQVKLNAYLTLALSFLFLKVNFFQFKTHLADEGVLYFVIREMEKHIRSENQEEEPQDSNKLVVERISFDVMERRWNNFEPLFGKEQEKVMYILLMYDLVHLQVFENKLKSGP